MKLATTDESSGTASWVNPDRIKVTHPRMSCSIDYFCTRYVYRITRLQRSVTGTRSTISKGGECKALDSNELTLKMVVGGEVVGQLRRKQYRALLDFSQLSPDARQLLTE